MLASRRIACSIHGSIVRIKCAVPALHAAAEHLLTPFIISDWPEGFIPVDGSLSPYDAAEVMAHLPASAKRFGTADAAMELYVDGDRFWLVDDRWGMTQIDFRSQSWHSWVLPAPTITPQEVVELALLWPVAQLLRNKGLYLLPAISITRGDWGVLLLSATGVEPELNEFVKNGYHVIGQRWTALREDDGAVAMLHVPGQLERGMTHRIGPTVPAFGVGGGMSLTDSSGWVDLAARVPTSTRHHAFCQAVILVESSRRPSGWVRPVASMHLLSLLEKHWPMVELQPTQRAGGEMLQRLAQSCPVFEMRLSRDPIEAVDQLEAIRSTGQPSLMEKRALWNAIPPLNLTPWSLAG